MSRVAFVFPGQGSQQPGMGRALAETFAESRAVFDEADRALDPPISAVCFEGQASELALTENTQPAILTVSVAALRALEHRGVKASGAAGHSLGEYSAHVAAGTFGFAGAVRAVRLRGRFMQDAVPVGRGAMAAIIGPSLAAVERICAEAAEGGVVSAANINAPGQVVIAGDAAAVERAGAACREAGARRVIPLAVSAPFHCSLMEPAAARLAPILEDLPFADPKLPVYTNVDAAAVQEAGAARDALVRQVASAVRWHETVERMLQDGYDTFVEIGPGRTLAGLIRRVDRSARVLNVEDPDGVEQVARELGS